MSQPKEASIDANSGGVLHLPRFHLHESLAPIDVIVYGVLLGLGALQIWMAQRTGDFLWGDVAYLELARSILDKGFYGFNFTPETVIPPGFPLILASVCMTASCTYTTLVRSISIFATLGFIASYELLYRLQNRAVAAAVCVLLSSSPIFFVLATRGLHTDVPYFFASMLTLLLVVRLDAAKNLRARVIMWLMCGFSLVASLLIRSVGIAFLSGLVMWAVASRFANREVWLRRLRTFAPLLLTGLFVQIIWMQWAANHEALQWPMVGGYPQSYIKQLEVRDGNNPELGKASLTDIPSRVERNLNERTITLTKLITRQQYVNPALYSPLVFGPILLILIGLAGSIWPDGGRLPEWYFISYETIYLLWPWYGDIRFFLPVAPLACLYLWCGAKTVFNIAYKRPQTIGAFSFPLSICLATLAGVEVWSSGKFQPGFSAIFWTLVAAVSAWMFWTGYYKRPEVFASFIGRFGRNLLVPVRVVGVLTVAALVAVGLFQQLAVGRNNLAFDATTQANYADVLAGKWVQANTARSTVVMARSLDVVYHYSQRKVVWFPPSSDPQLLMDGIHRHKVEFVIISKRAISYWLPPENVCFDSLLRTYPSAFYLVYEEPKFSVYRFVPENSRVGSFVRELS